MAGDHTIEQSEEDGTRDFGFMVLPTGALPELYASRIGQETALWAARQNGDAGRATHERRGPSWPWFLGWSLLSGSLWFLERHWSAKAEAPV